MSYIVEIEEGKSLPYTSMKDVPAVFKTVAPARGKRPIALSLTQINELVGIYDNAKKNPNVENPVGLAKAIFRRSHTVKNGKWHKKVKKESERGGYANGVQVEKSINIQEVLKSNESRRYIMGPVLIPGRPDLQEDVISREEIEKSFFSFFGNANIRIERQHSDKAVDAKVVERFLSSESVVVKDNSDEEYPPGTFFMGLILPMAKGNEEDIYEEVLQDPDLFGFSVRGIGKRRPIETSAEVS